MCAKPPSAAPPVNSAAARSPRPGLSPALAACRLASRSRRGQDTVCRWDASWPALSLHALASQTSPSGPRPRSPRRYEIEQRPCRVHTSSLSESPVRPIPTTSCPKQVKRRGSYPGSRSSNGSLRAANSIPADGRVHEWASQLPDPLAIHVVSEHIHRCAEAPPVSHAEPLPSALALNLRQTPDGFVSQVPIVPAAGVAGVGGLWTTDALAMAGRSNE